MRTLHKPTQIFREATLSVFLHRAMRTGVRIMIGLMPQQEVETSKIGDDIVVSDD